ncbi:prepilin-type N-terminal cleavage/methylation domain-containing protein [Acidithiobacillus acidisediminis]|uniref:prepilin-type N-terminal cleavage/methylation domain-containing protein n=1 Tax=Acidithiobacillus acidisediminis TaxID=2937799 RepID=UPI003D66498D
MCTQGWKNQAGFTLIELMSAPCVRRDGRCQFPLCFLPVSCALCKQGWEKQASA